MSKKIRRSFSPKQTVCVRAEQPIKSLDGALTLKPGQCITVFAFRFWKTMKAWVIRLRDGFEFLANHFTPSASQKKTR